MDVVFKALLVLHFIAWAHVIGAWLTHLKPPVVAKGVWHAAATALLTGIIMVGLAESGSAGPDELNMAKIGIKLIIAAAVVALAIVGERRGEKAGNLAHAVGGLAVLNVAIAVLWGSTHG